MSSSVLTWDATVPARPGINDVGGGAKENDPLFPPNPATMATAEDFNQVTKQVVAIGKVTPLAVMLVKFTAGSPAIDQLFAPSMNLVIGDFTIADVGVGETTITVAVNKLPAMTTAVVSQADDVEIDRLRAIVETALRVRVKSKLGASSTDCNFTLAIY